MTRIVLYYPVSYFNNKGFIAQVVGAAKCIRRYMPDAEIIVLSSQPAKDKKFETLGIQIRRLPWVKMSSSRVLTQASYAILIPFDFVRCLLCRLGGKFSQRIKHPYEQYDAVIQINSGGGLNDSAYGLCQISIALLQTLWLRVILRKPIATIPTDVGPLTTKFTRWLARFVFNRIDVLALRDEVSYDYSQRLGLSKPRVCLVADPGFLLEPAPQEVVQQILRQEGISRNARPFIGLSPNKHAMDSITFPGSESRKERQRKYLELMAAITDYLVDRLDATVCLIPFDVPDDREVCYRIYDLVKNREAVGLLREEYLFDELKGVVRGCDMLIGSRLHATIASTSLGVPTIAIGHGDRFRRIIGKGMGQEEYVVSIENPSFDELLAEVKSKIDALWANRDRIQQELRERTKIAQELAWSYGKLIQEMLESSKASP